MVMTRLLMREVMMYDDGDDYNLGFVDGGFAERCPPTYPEMGILVAFLVLEC